MADLIYTFAQFGSLAPGTVPQAGQLYEHIQQDGTLAPTFVGITFEGTEVTISFSGNLNAAQNAAVDAIVANHDGLGTAEDQSVSEPLVNVTIETANGVNFDGFITDTNNHVADTSNPHNTGIGDLPAFTLAEINARLSSGNLDLTSGTRDPNAHASSHSLGGADEIVLQNLSSGGQAEGLFPRSNLSGGFDLVTLGETSAFPTVSVYNTSSGPSLNTSTFTGIALNGTNHIDTDVFSFNSSNGQVTILQDGLYDVQGYASYEQSGGNTRTEGAFRIARNGTLLPGTIGYNYSRQQAQGRSNTMVSQTLTLSTGDVIQLQGRRNSGNGTLRPAANACGLVIQLAQGLQGPVGPQGLPGTGSSILVDENGGSTGVFTHLNFQNATVSDMGGGVADVALEAAPTQYFINRGSNLAYGDSNTRTVMSLQQAIPNGFWEVTAYAETTSSSTSAEWFIQLNRNGSPIGFARYELRDTDITRQFYFADIIEVLDGNINLALVTQRPSGSGTITINNPRIYIKRLA